MGTPAINYNNLMAQEMALYGGLSYGKNCPSFANGYMAQSNLYSGYPNYMGYNPSFTGYPTNSIYNTTPKTQNVQNTESSAASQPAFGASQEDLDILGKYYLEGMAPSESLLGAAGGGLAFSLINNPRLIAHPVNSFYATRETDKIFSGVKKAGSELQKMWLAEGEAYKGFHELLQDAYANVHKLNARMCDKMGYVKLGVFRSSLKGNPTAERLLQEITAELSKEKPDMNKIATLNEKIKLLTKRFDGHIARGAKKVGISKAGSGIKNFFKKIPLIGGLIKGGAKESPKAAAEKLVKEAPNKSLWSRVKTGCNGAGAIFMAAIEFIMDSGKIKEAFSKDSSTGWTQVGQTTVKGLGTAIGWGAGEAVGAWAGAKLGAIAGSAISPGVGTAIGAALGLVGGMVGSWLTGKITHKIVGQDVGDKVKVEKMKQTAQGQQELLQLTMQQAQDDKKLDKKTAQAIQNVYSVYA